MNSTTITLTVYLANIQIQIIRYLLTITLIIGNLSNLTNILIFSQHSLRSHICSWYFIGSSIGHLLYLNMGCLTRVISAWTHVLVLFNIRHTGHHQIAPTTLIGLNHEIRYRRRRLRKKDIQYIKLSLIQVAAYIVFNTLHGYNTIHEVITQNQIKTPEQRAIEGFLSGTGLNLHYVYTGITFFLYTLASETFRQACILFWKRWLEHLLHLMFLRSNHQTTVQIA
ncbi:unnamed protein product [Rotaria sp. Silwood1]|nr:unnamed protein product [Rotaria sp. Silwood1]